MHKEKLIARFLTHTLESNLLDILYYTINNQLKKSIYLNILLHHSFIKINSLVNYCLKGAVYILFCISTTVHDKKAKSSINTRIELLHTLKKNR